MSKALELIKYTISGLKTIIKDAGKLIAKKANEVKKKVRKATEFAGMQHGFSLNDLNDGSDAPESSKAKNPPNYRNPTNAIQTWSGRDKQPAWIKEAFESGRSPDEFGIK